MLYILCVYIFVDVSRKADWIRDSQHGALFVLGALILTSVPPIPGFTITVLAAGVVYGFPGGAPLAMTGAFLGAMACYSLVRTCNLTRFAPSTKKYAAIQNAIAERPVMTLVLRLTPIPWPINNLLISMVPGMSLSKYTLSAALSSTKVLIELWIGASLKSLSDPELPSSVRNMTLCLMVFGTLAVLLMGWWALKAASISESKTKMGSIPKPE
ncbi:hypothetical protein BCR43DRAFT_492015 [Syncephalastrum racemosum]|uniref:Golgi apparatus membrane protein TVP38 n=1 Tax=Syncephalastrum racemosum TaxID=13706 RepID=A0A1X2HCX4_SYNRA|nr:hypothetical protein BCR43DRAFT_492015 [Syncephalastrum racemosum]